jgi:hypothetical protein
VKAKKIAKDKMAEERLSGNSLTLTSDHRHASMSGDSQSTLTSNL